MTFWAGVWERIQIGMAHGHKTQAREPKDQQEAIANKHEVKEIELNSVYWLGGITAGIVVLTFIVTEATFGLYHWYTKHLPVGVSGVANMRRIPAAPTVQTDDGLQDLSEMRHDDEASLHTYGWTDRTNQHVRLPIERAKELVLNEGFPTRNSTPQKAKK